MSLSGSLEVEVENEVLNDAVKEFATEEVKTVEKEEAVDVADANDDVAAEINDPLSEIKEDLSEINEFFPSDSVATVVKDELTVAVPAPDI